MAAEDRVLWFFKLSRRQYYADFFITPPLTLVYACVSLSHGLSFLWLVMFGAGLLAWTAYEYLVHRYVLHDGVLKRMHQLHHAKPNDYIGVPPLATLAVYFSVWLMFGAASSAFMVGFSVGYIYYAALHTAIHYLKIGPGHLLHGAKRRHLVHHKKNSKFNYGVTTSLWDQVFGTNKD